MERRVYIILSDTGTLFTRMIKLYTKKPYNHASISFQSNLSEVYSFGRRHPKNPFAGGFVKECIHTGLLKKAKCAIYSCSVTEEQYQKMHQYLKQMNEQKDQYRYNLMGLIAIALKKNIDRKDAFFCSEFVTTILLQGEVIKLSKAPSLITPHDLGQVPQFDLLYRGDLKEYKELAMNSCKKEKVYNWKAQFRKVFTSI